MFNLKEFQATAAAFFNGNEKVYFIVYLTG